MIRWVAGTLFLVGLMTSTLQAQEAITIRYKGDKDAKQIYKRATKVNQTQSLMGMKVKTAINSTDFNVITFQGKDDKGNLLLRSENKGLKVKMELPQVGNYSFDSSKDDNDKASVLGNALTPIYERINGSILTLTLSPDGKLEKNRRVCGIDEGCSQG